jgi:hypothetical protein
MVEVRAGLLLGNEDDAEAVASGTNRKHGHITHILSITNEPPDWTHPDQSDALAAPPSPSTETEVAVGEVEDGSEGVVEGGEAQEVTQEEGGGSGVCKVPPLTTMFVQASDVPGTDLLHRFEECCQFIKQGVEQGGVIVHW